MSITALSHPKHRNMRLNAQQAILALSNKHILSVNVSELPQACCHFPVFFTNNINNGHLCLSILTSFIAHHCLFISNGQWGASFLPLEAQAYPFYLVDGESGAKHYTLGFDTASDALSEGGQGEAVFDAAGAFSPKVKQALAMLEGNLPQLVHSAEFIGYVQKYALIKTIELVLSFADGSTQTIAGLKTIDEDALANLPADVVAELNTRGYLLPLHAMLISLHQLNPLILRHNNRFTEQKIRKISLQVAAGKAVDAVVP